MKDEHDVSNLDYYRDNVHLQVAHGEYPAMSSANYLSWLAVWFDDHD